MPTKAAPIVGDALWLGISALVFAVIMGIMFWPLSVEWSRRMLAGPSPSGSPTAALNPEPGASAAAVPPFGTFGVNPILPRGPSSTMADAPNGSVPKTTTSIVALTEPAGVKSLLQIPLADQLQTSALANREVLTPASGGQQSAQSDSVLKVQQ